MIYGGPLFQLVCLFVCLKFANSFTPIDEEQRISNKIDPNLSIDRIIRYTPEMRLMLNGFLRYQNIAKRPEDTPYPQHLHTNRMKGSSNDDPLATILATGFLGSRGKKDDSEELPVYAHGFPAGRG